MTMPLQNQDTLFNRVISILEQTRSNVVRSVNSNTIIAYWMIGREIVEELQGGEDRAEYGKQVIEELSKQLTKKYGKGYSAPTLWNFRQFYQTYSDRHQTILSPAGRKKKKINHISELNSDTKLFPAGRELAFVEENFLNVDQLSKGFHPNLSWSHYRALTLL